MPNPGVNIEHPDLPGSTAANPQTPSDASSTPQQPPAVATTGQERLLAGKFRSVEELEKGYANSFEELRRIRSENQAALEQERQRVDALISRVGQPAAGDQKDIFDEFQTYGVPPELARNAVRHEVSRQLEQMGSAHERATRVAQDARRRVLEEYPEFGQSENAVSNFLQSDPSLLSRYTDMFGRDPQAAMEWGYLRYREANPPGSKRENPAAPDGSAAIPAGGSGGRVNPEPVTTTADDLEKAREYYKKYKDPAPYLRIRLRGLIPDSHFETR